MSSVGQILRKHDPNGHMTSMRRLIDVDATSSRRIDVNSTSLRRHVPAGDSEPNPLDILIVLTIITFCVCR